MKTWPLLLLVACAKQAAPVPIAAAPTPPRLQTQMGEHFAAAFRVLDATTEGRLADANEASAVLAGLDTSAVPEGWRPFLADVKQAAELGSRAATIEEVAHRIAEVGQACGECHSATGGGPRVATLDMLQWEDAEHGVRHSWAVDLMWLGLVTRSSDAWGRSVDGLLDHLPPAPPGANRANASRAVRKLEEAVQRGAAALDSDARVEAYAEVIATCQGCHGP